CKVRGGSDEHSTSLSIFNSLSSYSWDAKLVLILAAFALNYGEYRLLSLIYASNRLAKSMAILKQLPVSGLLKPGFEELKNLVSIMLDIARCIVEFNELPPKHFWPDVPAFSAVMAQIPTAVYWTIRSVVAYVTQITATTNMGHKNGQPLRFQKFAISMMEGLDFSTLTRKLNSIYEHLKEQIAICYKHIDEKKVAESFQMLVNLFGTVHVDNMKVLEALICGKDDQLPVFDRYTKRRVSLDVLRSKNVLLLISELDISEEEIWILEMILIGSRHQAPRQYSQYEVVWIPIVDRNILWNDSMQKQFETLKFRMPWYMVHHPSLTETAVIKFINEVWKYRNKPMVVVIDHQGRVVCQNAIHMMWIWGSRAFPFTSLIEEALWKEETWRIELLVDNIDPTILDWIKKGKCIMLYGGDYIEAAKEFMKVARAIALAGEIPLEMVYVGKSCERESVRKVISTITKEKLSYCWQDMTMIWFFWTRLESMLFSKMQLGNADDHDPIVQGIKKLLKYDKESFWAMPFMEDEKRDTEYFQMLESFSEMSSF
ncbi:protein SIEVE ELEMENT OCCLUSION B-like, partial [Tripterygium wilfordii]